MRIPRFLLATHHIRTRHWIYLFFILALFYRALIPAGYMPDTQALQQGQFQLTLCDMLNIKPMHQHAGHHHTETSSETEATTPVLCPFHVAFAQAVATAFVVFFAFSSSVSPLRHAESIPCFYTSYPVYPLGSQAPPSALL